MTESPETTLPGHVERVARRARGVSRELAGLSLETRNAALEYAAAQLENNAAAILAANAEDVRAAETLVRDGQMSPALLARLRTSEKGVRDMAEKVRSVARLPDPLGRKLAATELDTGLVLTKESCPLGVVAVVFESRPDVIPQIASLALKSGNAAILKGGSEAARSNQALITIWRAALRAAHIAEDAAQLLDSRGQVQTLLGMEKEVDVLIPRGGKEFVARIARESRIPVLGHGEGICHVYVHAAADFEKAARIVLDAKTDYPAACNAAETLLVDASIAEKFLPSMIEKLHKAGVEVRGDKATQALMGLPGQRSLEENDWSTEYGDLILAVRVVSGLDAAIEHIFQHGSRHTESIVTEDSGAAERFLNEVDAAGVYHNASTRFADGYRYGLGAEVGISNGKLHSRGPMGLDGLTTYKFKLRGSGQTASDYKTKPFLHRPL